MKLGLIQQRNYNTLAASHEMPEHTTRANLNSFRGFVHCEENALKADSKSEVDAIPTQSCSAVLSLCRKQLD
jgi:hypothetical protein